MTFAEIILQADSRGSSLFPCFKELGLSVVMGGARSFTDAFDLHLGQSLFPAL